MLSKEEIEFNLKALSGVMLNFEDILCDEMQQRVKEVKEYIDQLESDNYEANNIINEYIEERQKIIEKLEERKRQNNNRYGKSIDSDEYEKMYEYSGKVEEDDYILSILGGNK